MQVNAVLEKELRTRMRGWRAAAVITAYLALLAAIALIFLNTSNAPESYAASANTGQQLFEWLAGFQMALLIFVTPASTAGAISGERQRQTLDLLLVSRLSSLSIVLGKLAAGLAFDVLLIVCSAPLFSLIFLYGGIGVPDLLHMLGTFLATTLLLGSIALFISTLARRGSAATVVSMLAALILTVGLGILSLYLAFSRAGSGGSPSNSIPLPAYLDPILAFLAALPSTAWNPNVDHIGGGFLHLSIWQDQIIVDVIASLLLIAGSERLLRPRL
jgi:ABC-2 type transport system permease protein